MTKTMSNMQWVSDNTTMEELMQMPSMTEENANSILEDIKNSSNKPYTEINGMQLSNDTTHIWRVGRAIHFNRQPSSHEVAKHNYPQCWSSMEFPDECRVGIVGKSYDESLEKGNDE